MHPMRFSRVKRFFLRVTLGEFFEAANQLGNIVREHHPRATLEVLVCEDLGTYNYSTVTFCCDEVTEALKARKHYSLSELSAQVWERAFKVQVVLRDSTVPKPLEIWLTLDRFAEPRKLNFHFVSVSDRLVAGLAHFMRPSMFFGIGSGYPVPSDFNVSFGKRLTGL